MKDRIINYIKAGYPGLNIVSAEEARVEALMRDVIATLNHGKDEDEFFSLSAWSCTTGLVNITDGKDLGCQEPIEMLSNFLEAHERSVFLLRDFHTFTEDRNPVIWRKVKDALIHAKTTNKALVILGCRLCLPPELEKEITVIDFALPDRAQLRNILHNLLENNGHNKSLDDEAGILSAAQGLSTTEAENAFALSVVEMGTVTRDVVYREKCQAVRKSGLLEVVDTKGLTMDDVGGLASLKHWLIEGKDNFTDEAKEYGLPELKGFLAVGQPGTGKSLTAKACRAVFNIPLLRLDAGRLMGSLVGQSEANWRSAHGTALAMAPCILWIDEADGAFAGAGSSGQTDGGTTARVIKSILQDMQENSKGILYVMTANDVDNLPAPLLRRMDEIWNVELPSVSEREQIWGIQIKKVSRKPEKFDLKKLASGTDGYSGAEIEKIVAQSLRRAFADGRREPNTEDALAIIDQFTPLSKTMADDINKRRERLKGVAKLASAPVNVVATPAAATRKIAKFRSS